MFRLLIFIASVYFIISLAHAQDDKSLFPQKNWSSTSANDVVTITNSSGYRMVVIITVGGTGNETGINLTNCGTTTSVAAGDTVICPVNDSRNPVSIVTSNVNKPVSGTYQLKMMQP